ncbi:MAG: hypothetical protein O2907_06115, partial [Proteobacteria bacterium]|nr:hypothetical protein [Pseudomonadota bacterium]
RVRVLPQRKKERDFLLRATAAIWAQGVDVATDSGLRKVTDACGLFWPDVKAALADDGWKKPPRRIASR